MPYITDHTPVTYLGLRVCMCCLLRHIHGEPQLASFYNTVHCSVGDVTVDDLGVCYNPEIYVKEDQNRWDTIDTGELMLIARCLIRKVAGAQDTEQFERMTPAVFKDLSDWQAAAVYSLRSTLS